MGQQAMSSSRENTRHGVTETFDSESMEIFKLEEKIEDEVWMSCLLARDQI